MAPTGFDIVAPSERPHRQGSSKALAFVSAVALAVSAAACTNLAEPSPSDRGEILFVMSAVCRNASTIGVDIHMDFLYVGSVTPGNSFIQSFALGNHNLRSVYKFSGGGTQEFLQTVTVTPTRGTWSLGC